MTDDALPTATDIALSNSLADLAARIRAEHEAAGAAMKRGIEHAMMAGDLLLEAKAQLKHGQWMPWLEANCAMSGRTARRYMLFAQHRSEIEAKMASVANLTIEGAAKLLVPKSKLPAHPVIECFPMMSDAALDSLAADITMHGLINPITLGWWTAEDGKLQYGVIDGRCRLRACEIAGVEPQFEELPEGTDPLAFIISMNMVRAHYGEDVRAMAAARLSGTAEQCGTLQRRHLNESQRGPERRDGRHACGRASRGVSRWTLEAAPTENAVPRRPCCWGAVKKGAGARSGARVKDPPRACRVSAFLPAGRRVKMSIGNPDPGPMRRGLGPGLMRDVGGGVSRALHNHRKRIAFPAVEEYG